MFIHAKCPEKIHLKIGISDRVILAMTEFFVETFIEDMGARIASPQRYFTPNL